MLVITQQIKAARALLSWGQGDLAIKSGVAISTIRRLEASNGPLSARFDTIAKIRRTFEEAGIRFSGEPHPGVCLTEGSQNSLG